MRPPRILHLGKYYPPYKGGMETHLQVLCRSLVSRAEIEVIVANSSNCTQVDYDGNIRIQRVAAITRIASAPICPKLASAIRQTPADIVHLHSPNPTAVLSYFLSGHPGKLVVTHHSDIIRQRIFRLGFEPLLQRLMNRAEAIICFSPNYAESSAVLARYLEKCHVIPHGIDPAIFQNVNSDEIESIRTKYGNNIVLAVGRLVYYKGFEYLINAIAETQAALLIIGTGPLREQLLRTAQRNHAADRVHLLGEVSDLVPYYHAARIFALPSVARSEAFGIVQLEAMCCGTPVINTRLRSGVPFVSLDNVSGLTVPPADVIALRREIRTLLSDDALHSFLSAGARRRVAEHFTIDNMADRTMELYESVLQSEGNGIAIPDGVPIARYATV